MPGQRKGLALLALLAAAGERGFARETVCAYLWPESDDEHARTSLRQLIHALRRQLATPNLLPAGVTLRLDSQVVTSDVADFQAALERRDYAAAVALYTGPFLDGFYLKNADELERWVADERASLANAHARALEALAEQVSGNGDKRGAVEVWRRLTSLEPLSARAAIGLMKALAAAGERSAALRHAQLYAQLVHDEAGAKPDPSVEALAAQLQSSGSPNGTPASIAVLPFTNTGGDAADEHFSDGLTDELIATLGRVEGLAVKGRTSVFALKGTPLGSRAIADALGVSTFVEGSVRRAGDRVRVSAQVVSAVDGAVRWTATFERPAGDIFAVQDEIARAVADALRVKLGAARAHTQRPPASFAAYEAYLKGRHILNTRSSKERLLQAIQYFQHAAQNDPLYAPAFAGLSDAYASLAIFAYGRAGDEFPKAMAAARKALALDDTLAEAHASLAHALCVHDFEWTAAEREFRRSISLDPGYVFARIAFAICLQDQGRFDEAVSQLEAARTADPLAPHVNAVLGRVYVNARQPDRAIAALHEALRIGPELDLVYQQLGHAYLQKRMPNDAINALRRAAELSGMRDSAHLAYGYAVTGNRAEAEHIVAALLDATRNQDPPPFHVAMALVGLGDHDAAFEWLDRAYVERASFMDGVNVTPAFDPLRSDPRWATLVQRMGLV
ncbi:MAG TPA: BTAD domain-containing putative transcriptional regulator [Gemmatimonadaceae bacterium]|nr:BTAD domain-containing putative transcriptional regulator [Gemmatimonadaceae bacterium]